MASLLRRAAVGPAIIAGLIAGATLELFLIATQWSSGGLTGAAAGLVAVAAGAAGPQIVATPYALAFGIAVHFAISVLWALGYVWLAERQPQLVTRPVISGLGFGIIVWFAMQAMLVAAGQFHQPTIYSFDREIVGHMLFFGLPLAVVAARLTRTR